MRVFLTVGTQLPFDRLVKGVDAWAAANPEAEIFGQIAEGGWQPRHFRAVAFVEPAEIDARMRTADVLVAHAGMGTIIKALSLGKPLVLMGRKAALGEQRNDHQLATVRQFATRPGIAAAEDTADVPACLDAMAGAAVTPEAIGSEADPRLVAAVRAAILG